MAVRISFVAFWGEQVRLFTHSIRRLRRSITLHAVGPQGGRMPSEFAQPTGEALNSRHGGIDRDRFTYVLEAATLAARTVDATAESIGAGHAKS